MDNLVTVFRSADSSAEEDAKFVLETLTQSGITAALADDQARGVPSGAWEVRVASADKERAEAVMAANPIEDEFAEVNESHDLDLVTVFQSAGNTSEMEAMSVLAMLKSNGIYAMTTADPRFPNLPDEVRVPQDKVAEAKRLIAEALAAGPAAADEAEAGTES
ncbi:MAG: hypothetical protein ABSB35_12880 [Bryobacteraceae bacterium]|jgi:hypothetical protein